MPHTSTVFRCLKPVLFVLLAYSLLGRKLPKLEASMVIRWWLFGRTKSFTSFLSGHFTNIVLDAAICIHDISLSGPYLSVSMAFVVICQNPVFRFSVHFSTLPRHRLYHCLRCQKFFLALTLHYDPWWHGIYPFIDLGVFSLSNSTFVSGSSSYMGLFGRKVLSAWAFGVAVSFDDWWLAVD